VQDNGATGDGKTKDTTVRIKVIDVFSTQRGGMVIVPAGTYLCGTIYLKNNVDLHLTSGATILGSDNREDYNYPNIFPENPIYAPENTFGTHLIIAFKMSNVSITENSII
jgi:polygalacturonase